MKREEDEKGWKIWVYLMEVCEDYDEHDEQRRVEDEEKEK